MRRARYLAGDDNSIETSSALLCLCCPAILTRTCAPAWQAGLSTDSRMDHQMSSPRDHDGSRTNAMLSTARVQPCSIEQRRRSCRIRRRRDARCKRPAAAHGLRSWHDRPASSSTAARRRCEPSDAELGSVSARTKSGRIWCAEPAMAKSHKPFIEIAGGPRRTRTCNQTVMSGPACSKVSENIDVFRGVASRASTFVHPVAVVNRWSNSEGRRTTSVDEPISSK